MNQLYNTLEISKQSVYQYQNRQLVFDNRINTLIVEADELRADFPGCGVEKMYDILKPDFIGRDRFVETMMSIGYRLKKKRNYVKTTIASKIYFPNLIKGMIINKPSAIWQSDITYIPVAGKHYYAVFIIDIYTKKIVGYSISDNMRATANVNALKMALKYHEPPEIHHSDRGGQYVYKGYVNLLNEIGSKISMALSAQDNAYAERINRTIKRDYLDHWNIQDFKELKKRIKHAVSHYNEVRTHDNIGKQTPIEFERLCHNTSPKNRKSITIFNNELIN